jgi:hypothetical protein
MSSFETTLCIPAHLLPAEFIRLFNGRGPDGCALGPTDTADDVLVEVDYRGGWFKPGRYHGKPENCYPDEGENPEILSVVLQDEEYKERTDLVNVLPANMLRDLEEQAWGHQQETERDHYNEDGGDDPYEPYGGEE